MFVSKSSLLDSFRKHQIQTAPRLSRRNHTHVAHVWTPMSTFRRKKMAGLRRSCLFCVAAAVWSGRLCSGGCSSFGVRRLAAALVV